MDNQTFKSWAGKGPVGLCESNKPDAQMILLKVKRGLLLSLHVTAHIPQFSSKQKKIKTTGHILLTVQDVATFVHTVKWNELYFPTVKTLTHGSLTIINICPCAATIMERKHCFIIDSDHVLQEQAKHIWFKMKYLWWSLCILCLRYSHLGKNHCRWLSLCCVCVMSRDC